MLNDIYANFLELPKDEQMKFFNLLAMLKGSVDF